MSGIRVGRRRLLSVAICLTSVIAFGVVISLADDGIVVTSVRPERGITNGAAFDVTQLRPDSPCITLPPGTIVGRARGQVVRLVLEKRIVFVGTPPQSIDPALARRSMGVAWRRVGECIEVGSFGQWGGHEGGAGVILTAAVPDGIDVVISADPTPEGGAAAGPGDLEWAIDHIGQSDWWYATPMPAAGWTRLPDRPVDSVQPRAGFAGTPGLRSSTTAALIASMALLPRSDGGHSVFMHLSAIDRLTYENHSRIFRG